MTSDARCLKSLSLGGIDLITEWQKKLPIRLTMSRVYVVPVILLCLYPNRLFLDILAAVLFVAASITDYYDGYFARKYGVVSNMGKFMDPVTDKILVSSILIFLVALRKLDPYLVILLLVRDTFIGGLRSVAATDQIVIDAKTSGKWKTGLQMASIPAVMIADFSKDLWPDWKDYSHENLFSLLGWTGYFVLWGSVVLSLLSGVQYYNIYLREKQRKQNA